MIDLNRQREKAEELRRLHHGTRILVLPNTGDVASSKLVEEAGFAAVATSSAGVCWTLGYADGERIPREEMLAMVEKIASAVELPVTADLEAGYGLQPATVAETAGLAVRAGAAGMNLEDSRRGKMLDLELGAERVVAAREGARQAGGDLVLNARIDGFLRLGKSTDVLEDTIRRAGAYQAVGADCIFVPGVDDEETIAALAAEIDGPINILAHGGTAPIPRLAELGVARVSIGDLLSLMSAARVRAALSELRGPGTYGFAEGAPSYGEVNRLFG